MNTDKIILFDGVCNLCNSSVQKVIENDDKNVFRFASLQSDFGQEFLKKNNFDTGTYDSMILIDGDKFYTRSDAALRIGKELRGFKKISGLLLLIPKPVRNAVYNIIAKNRYKWFGKKESCWLPTPELKQKFIS